MTATRTELQAALRKACEEAAKDIIRDAQCSVNLTCPSENSLISRMLQYVPPLFEALVAAAYARATNLIAQVRDDYHSNDGPFDMGMRLQMLENEVCSLTPADAARELERRELEKVIEGLKTARARTLPGCRTIVNLGHVPEAVRAGEWVQMDIEGEIADVEQRLASLSKPAPVERSNEAIEAQAKEKP